MKAQVGFRAMRRGETWVPRAEQGQWQEGKRVEEQHLWVRQRGPAGTRESSIMAEEGEVCRVSGVGGMWGLLRAASQSNQ